MAHKKRKVPKLIVSKNSFSRFLEKNYGYTDVRQFTTPEKFSSRLNSIFLAKDASGKDVFIKACRYGDMSENEYKAGLELWEQAPTHFAKPLAYHSGKRFSFCCSEYAPGTDLRTIMLRGDTLTGEQKARIVEDLYEIAQALKRADIVHRDAAMKNMLYHDGRVVLIDCQLATKRTATEQISFFDNILKVCMWKREHTLCMDVLCWEEMGNILHAVKTIGAEPEYRKRYDEICAELKRDMGKYKYVYPYPSMDEIDHCMKICKLRSLFHPKSKLRERYRHVLDMIRYFKQHHPELKNEA